VEATNLAMVGDVTIAQSTQGRWHTYAATQQGLQRGERLLASIVPEAARRYIEEVARWVLEQSFGSLVRSIYNAYPEMRQNSIFQG
jgi:hypothetical protein